jgi:hypothetical protein
MEKLHHAVKQLIPDIRLALAKRAGLTERLQVLSRQKGAGRLSKRSTQEQANYLRAQSLVHMSGIYLGSAVTNLAHSPEAFALIVPELDPGIAQHALDTVADEVAFAPGQGVTAEAAIVASLASIEDDLALAKSHLDRACTFLASIPERR